MLSRAGFGPAALRQVPNQTVVDEELIRRQLGYLETTVGKLRELAGPASEETRETTEKAWAVQRGLQIAIQALLDVGNHLLAEAAANDVEEYGEIIVKLGERGILPAEFARRIRPMAGLRNLLVHGYTRVDEGRVAQILRDHVGDFATFSAHVLRYIEQRKQ